MAPPEAGRQNLGLAVERLLSNRSNNMTWDYDKTAYDKQAQADPKWHLERLINYGLGEVKIDREILKKYLAELNIPDDRRAFLELLIWNKRY